MKQPLKVGDRVACYWAETADTYVRTIGTIVNIPPTTNILTVSVSENDDGYFTKDEHTYFHIKQCRRLRPKEKSVKVTKKKLAEAWDKHVVKDLKEYTHPLIVLDDLCRELGLG